MANKKITIRDVAQEAGVSVATVSYIINDRKDVKISEATRKKVLQVINLLNYSPNQTAKALASNKRGQIAFSITNNSSPIKLAERMYVMKKLSGFFHKKGFELLFLPCDCLEKYDLVDAILCFDMPKEDFKKLGDVNFAPLIALDTYIDDPLFFQINTKVSEVKKKADEHFNNQSYIYVSTAPEEEKVKEILEKTFANIVFVETISDLNAVAGKNILVTSSVLKDCLPSEKNLFYVPSYTEEKCETIFECFKKASDRIPIESHDIEI